MRRRSTLTAARAIRGLFLSVPLALGVVIALAPGASGSAGTGRAAAVARADAALPGRGHSSVPGAARSLAGSWKLLPAAPVTTAPAGLVSVWTGHEMIIHGIVPGVTFAYRPAADTWARLRPGPKPLAGLEADDVAVWTGSRMLVMGLTNGSYNPVANTWRPIARLGTPDEAAVVAWTGRQAIIWGGVCCSGVSNGGAAYDPGTNTWRQLPNAPLQPRRSAAGTWTGRELIVAGGFTFDHNRLFRNAAAYNPATRTWRTIAPMPLGRWGATAVWDGNEVLVIGGYIGGGVTARNRLAVRGLAYNPAANRWRWLPKMAYPRSGFAAVWTGRQLLVWGGLTATHIPPPHGEAFDPATSRWTALPASPLRGRADPVAVWTGRLMIVWGGSASGHRFTDGAAFIPAAGSWGEAIELPGLAALNKGDANVSSVSCASAGNCAAGGNYIDRHGHEQGFVASQRNGRWGKAIEVPGLGALNKGDVFVFEVSCGSAGNCAAGGPYTDRRGDQQGFVVIERNGRWGQAIEVPGLGALNTGEAHVSSVSCASAGNCAAGGGYTDRRGNGQGFVVVERNGRWGQAIEVPGLAALNTGGLADVSEVSCASAGNCSAGGDYTDRSFNEQGFVVSQRRGRWGKAIEVPGLGALNKGGNARVYSVSCASAGNCAAGGFYTDRSFNEQGFVVSQRNGVWHRALEVPGLGALNKGVEAEVFSVSCASAGSCAAGGGYADRHGTGQGFVAVERNGVWGRAIEVPGPGALNVGGGDGAVVNSVSCASAGNCSAGGGYTDRRGNGQGFVAVERHGVWGKAIEVPGLGALNTGGGAAVLEVSCAPAGGCAAGGYYTDHLGLNQGFVVSQTG